jgi:hypothetical protein
VGKEMTRDRYKIPEREKYAVPEHGKKNKKDVLDRLPKTPKGNVYIPDGVFVDLSAPGGVSLAETIEAHIRNREIDIELIKKYKPMKITGIAV